MLLTAVALNSQQSKSLESCSTVSEVTKPSIHLGSAFLCCTGYISFLKPYKFEEKKYGSFTIFKAGNIYCECWVHY